MRRIVRAAQEADCDSVVVVGDRREQIEGELRKMPAAIVHNLQWQRGLGTSIRCGLRHLLAAHPDLDAALLLTCDQPMVDAATIATLIALRENSGKPIVASAYAKTIGVPALFDRSCFAELLAIADNSGAKALIESRPNDISKMPFEAGALDIDTPADLAGLAQAEPQVL